MGFVVNVKGQKSHQIVKDGIRVLLNLNHRGACGCEANTGDGAGILLQMPHAFLQEVCKKARIALPGANEYGSGLVFLPQDPKQRRLVEDRFEKIIQSEGQRFLGWRTVPTQNASLGATAKSCEPFVRQVFIGRDASLDDDAAFERKLYVIRKRSYTEIRKSAMDGSGVARATRPPRSATRRPERPRQTGARCCVVRLRRAASRCRSISRI